MRTSDDALTAAAGGASRWQFCRTRELGLAAASRGGGGGARWGRAGRRRGRGGARRRLTVMETRCRVPERVRSRLDGVRTARMWKDLLVSSFE